MSDEFKTRKPVKNCCACGGTGQADSGASYEWGEFISKPCECLETKSPDSKRQQGADMTDGKQVLLLARKIFNKHGLRQTFFQIIDKHFQKR